MMQRKGVRTWIAAAGVASLVGVAVGGTAHANGIGRFVEHDLVSDVAGRADLQDTNLVNVWGMAQGPTSPVWVAANHTNVATLYSGDGVTGPPTKVPLVVSVPGDGVTGQVFNPTPGFVVDDGAGHSGAALFLFDSESGDVTGWSPGVPPPPPSTKAQPAAHVDGAVFKGLAMATTQSGKDRLYAADFHHGTIQVFDNTFKHLDLDGAFVDRQLPDGYAPFNVAAIGGNLYVAYAKQDSAKVDEVAGAGKGFVDVYDPAGHLLRRLISRGALNAPWGMTIAPDGFGDLGGALLVGNFGDGRINAYNATTGNVPRDPPEAQRPRRPDRRPLGADVRERHDGRHEHAAVQRRARQREPRPVRGHHHHALSGSSTGRSGSGTGAGPPRRPMRSVGPPVRGEPKGRRARTAAVSSSTRRAGSA